jgi:hypothetical protein
MATLLPCVDSFTGHSDSTEGTRKRESVQAIAEKKKNSFVHLIHTYSENQKTALCDR